MITKHERLHALENQIHRLNRHIETLNQRSNRLSWVRLTIFLAGLFLSIIVFFMGGWLWSLAIAAITLIVFSIAVYYHRQIERSITRHKIWRQIKSTHVARMQLDWANIPSISTASPVANHPFETDLDITGNHSLHQLITTAVSFEGKQRVREWLLHTSPDIQTIRKRQALLQELTPLSRFRDKLTLKSLLASTNVAEHLEGKRLLNWLNLPQAAGNTSAVSLNNHRRNRFISSHNRPCALKQLRADWTSVLDNRCPALHWLVLGEKKRTRRSL